MKRTSTILNWKTTAEDFSLLSAIADRAVELARDLRVEYPKHLALMDLTAVHCNGLPLSLRELLVADPGNFAHDVLGIRKHIDRSTGQLQDCFTPRFAAPEVSA